MNRSELSIAFEPELSSSVDPPEISLIMPAYNEGRTIQKVVERADRVVKTTGLNYEIIVVDDGSIDDTRKKMVDFASYNGHLRVVSLSKNMGKGYAVRKGFAQARGEFIVFMDSDMDVDPSQISRYVEALRHGDIVVASKWHPKSHAEVPLPRKILSHSFNALVRLLTGIRLKDTQTGLKAIRKQALIKLVPKLAVKRYAFDVELLTVANLHGLKIVELPIKIRMYKSLFSFREVWGMFLDLLGITYRFRIRKLYGHSD